MKTRHELESRVRWLSIINQEIVKRSNNSRASIPKSFFTFDLTQKEIKKRIVSEFNKMKPNKKLKTKFVGPFGVFHSVKN